MIHLARQDDTAVIPSLLLRCGQVANTMSEVRTIDVRTVADDRSTHERAAGDRLAFDGWLIEVTEPAGCELCVPCGRSGMVEAGRQMMADLYGGQGR